MLLLSIIMEESLPFSSYTQMECLMDSQDLDHEEEICTTDEDRHTNVYSDRKRKQPEASTSEQSDIAEQKAAKFMRIDSSSESEPEEVEDNHTAGKTFSSKERAS